MMDAALLFSHLCFIFLSNMSQTPDEPDFFHCPSPWIPVSCPAQVPVEHCLLAHRSLQVPACSSAIPPRDLAVLWSLSSYSTFPIFGFVSPAACWFHPAHLQPQPRQCSAGTPPRWHLLHPLISPCSHDIITISDLPFLFVPLLKIIDSYWLKKKEKLVLVSFINTLSIHVKKSGFFTFCVKPSTDG